MTGLTATLTPYAEKRAKLLVLGVGNELLTDEGLGVEAARQLAALRLPGVEVVDGATLGLGLLPEIADRGALLLLDAIASTDAQPGDVITLTGDAVPRARALLTSAHEVGVAEALAAADLAGCAPGTVVAVGMVPESLETGFGLTDTVAARIPAVVDAALAVLASWGVAGAATAAGSGPEHADA